MSPTRTITVALAAAALLFAACGDDDDTATGDTDSSATAPAESGDDGGAGSGDTVDAVTIVDFDYDPKEAVVAAGSDITFTNEDDTAHTATANDGSFNTKSIAGGESGTATAPDEPGTYEYICSFHPFMKGTLVVE